MADLLFLLVTVAFFAAAAGFVLLCDRIIGPDAEHRRAPASRRRRASTPRRVRWAPAMTADNVVALVIAVLVAGYLVLTLVFPEKF